jgi:hypothetical protein
MSEIVGDPVAVEAPPAVAEPAAEEAPWSGPSQEEWEQVVGGLGYLAQQVQPPPPPEVQQPQQTQFDPFSDDPGSQLRSIIREELAPLANYQQHEQLAEAEEKAYDILDDVSSRLGEIVDKDTAFPIIRAWADTMMPEMAQRYGFGPRAAEAALEQAFTGYQTLEQSIGKSYTDRHMNQLTNLSGVRAEPPAFNGAAQTTEIPRGGDELEIVRRFGGFPGP